MSSLDDIIEVRELKHALGVKMVLQGSRLPRSVRILVCSPGSTLI